MAFKFIFIHFITAMLAVNLICADEESERFFGLPFFGGGGGGGSNGSSGFGFLFSGSNGSSGLPNFPFFDHLPSFFGSRQERSVEPQEDDDGGNQERFFFGSIVSCNYTTQNGTNCVGCRQSLACYPNNIGRVRTCKGFLRYCNDGRCSFTPPANCSSSG